MQNTSAYARSDLLLALVILGAITIIRLAVLALTDFNLGPEEAQYWSWSREPAFGYYSKPPLIAWLIGLSTSVCGSGEWCVRFPSPLLHFATSLVLFFLGRDLYDSRTGFWAAISYATIPGVWYSSGLMTADVPLLFFWSVCLLSLWRLAQTGAAIWAVIFGVAFGLGLMSKYAMLYFLLCLAVYLVLRPAAFSNISPRVKLVAVAIPTIIFSPNLYWNIKNGFLTLVHTAENINLEDGIVNPINLLEFIAAQFAILGPILFGVLLWQSRRAFGSEAGDDQARSHDVFLLSFSLPVLALVGLIAFTFKANANWAAAALVSACVFAVAWLRRQSSNRLLYASHAIHGLLALFLMSVALSPAFATFALNDESIDKIKGWGEFARKVEALTAQLDYDLILMDHRPTMAELLYYGRDLNVPVRMWNEDGVIQNHYELAQAYQSAPAGPILLIAVKKPPSSILFEFENQMFLTKLVTVIREDMSREVLVYRLEGAGGT